jgi:hypothetical protein
MEVGRESGPGAAISITNESKTPWLADRRVRRFSFGRSGSLHRACHETNLSTFAVTMAQPGSTPDLVSGSER